MVMKRSAFKRRIAPWALAVLMLAVYLLAAWIEPCEDGSGHSCARTERSAH
jgi:hypothetical protein